MKTMKTKTPKKYTIKKYTMKTHTMKTTIHHGPYTTIPTLTTPGLHFLKTFLPALDSLDA